MYKVVFCLQGNATTIWTAVLHEGEHDHMNPSLQMDPGLMWFSCHSLCNVPMYAMKTHCCVTCCSHICLQEGTSGL